ncbi:enoyl-[acyl-carrier-protein] reductase FabK [Ruminococcaceae bacterium OttesenSCG-928-D13]|nr:enoyl-[acyl-carrier-protein] reductase FabK [Ruminococcaceae bacterium OttesenSCG-928-D13]
MDSPLCSLLGIQYPVLQGGMAWIADASLAAAVSEAGGLGIISAMNASADWLREEIRTAKKLTGRPFGVNIMLMSPHVEDVARVVVEEGVPVVTTGAGNPGKHMGPWKEAGIKVLPVVASVALARMMQRSGASAVIAEGGESGGHIGEASTMALVPQVASAVDIPVVAAGGIADGRGMAASLMLGACGVQMGTRFLVADECTVHENYKARVLKARDIDTMATGRRLGHPVRCIKNPFSREFLRKEYDSSVTDEALEAFGGGALYRAAKEGDMETGSILAGQIAGMVTRRQPAAEIISEVCAEAEVLLKGASQWVK